MAIDPMSPIAPARIRALLLPVGRIKRSRFMTFVDLLQPECMIRLGDISPDPRPDRNMFSPLAFPPGTLLYDFSTSLPSSSQLSLSPFEQFREPLLVIGVGDAAEYPWLSFSQPENGFSEVEESSPGASEEDASDLTHAIEDLREQFPRVYLHSLMMFDCSRRSRHPWLPEEAILVPPVAQMKTTTLKTFICDLSASLLAEMTSLAKSIQALPTIKSPVSHQSGAADDSSTWPGSEPSTPALSRRNSQMPFSSRSESPATIAQKDLHRMSMPVHLPSATSPAMSVQGDSRPTSPNSVDVRSPPATTFDEIAGINPLSRTDTSTGQPKGSNRDSSVDRASITGFGSGGVNERARNKGRGRVGVVIGTLYLCAGRWNDALKELVESATRARGLSDHLWHAKALENILVCLLLFAWSGMDFQVPQICYPITDAFKNSAVKSPQHTPSNSVADVSTAGLPNSSSHQTSLQNLMTVIPDYVNMILSIYTRAANFSGEAMPPLAFSESVIRCSRLLTTMYLSGGVLNDSALHHLVCGTPIRQNARLSVPRLALNPSRNEVAAMLFRALPSPSESAGLGPIDRVTVLAGIASVLSSLGLQRKKAIVMKEFISSLIPGLVQARKVGAAEMGVHPAAGLAALNMASGGSAGAGALNLGEGEIENGIDVFLSLLGRIYGVPDTRNAHFALDRRSHDATNGDTSNETEKLLQEIIDTSSLRSFGSLHLKLDVLRMCISFCEALPDFQGVLRFTAMLLRIAGPGTAPSPNSTDVFVSLAREEQIRLATNISRTIGAAEKLGIQNIETEYWDDFLVRGLHVLDAPSSLRLTQHRPAELKTLTSKKEGPFLHNPFLKKPDTDASEKILVANQEYGFVVALQNPYDFEVEIDSLKLAGDGVEFAAREYQFTIGAYRTQKFSLTGVARSPGILSINGCFVKIRGCRERLFPVFTDPWKPQTESKMKNMGLKASVSAPSSRPASAIMTTDVLAPPLTPKVTTLTMTAIPEQPVVVVTDVSLPQSSLMVLEGESEKFFITLRNTSSTTTVDFVHISFQDSATTALQQAASNKDLPASELHEIEYQLAHLPSLRWLKGDEDESTTIQPGATASFEIEVIGRTRLTDAVVQFDYASLSKRKSEIKERFFTRQLSVPISVTVNASVQLQRSDIVPLSGDFSWANQQQASGDESPNTVEMASSDADSSHFRFLLNSIGSHDTSSDHCMFLLDFRNAWPNPLSISLEVLADSPDQTNISAVNEIIQPGHINRIVVVLPKLYLSDPYAPIPSLNPANQRQFVVTASKAPPEVERANREAFWYREELLKRVRGTWKEEGKGRHGEIELRMLRLNARMVESMKLDDVAIDTTIVPDEEQGRAGMKAVYRTGRSKFEVLTNEFLTLRTKITNRSPQPIYPLLRLQPHVAGLAHNLALDLDKRFSWTGVLQRKLPLLRPGESVESELGIVALSSGVFEVGAMVEEVKGWKEEGDGGEAKARERSGTGLMERKVLGEVGLRCWYVREGCVVVARGGDV